MTDDEDEYEELTRSSGKGMESDLESNPDALADESVHSGYDGRYMTEEDAEEDDDE
nr:hypothetical protein [Haloferax sp. BAB-2207]